MRIYITLLLSICNAIALGQSDSVRYIKYTPDFKFNEGIYLDFEQMKRNSPISLEKIITSLDITELGFFEDLLKEETISIFDDNGMQKDIKVEDIWGYCRMGALYIALNDDFNRIPVIGNISHFVSNYKIENNNQPYPYTPYSYNDPYYHYNTRSYVTREMRQYLLDWETGDIYEYDYRSLKVILMRDPELYEEYNNLRKRKQKKFVFMYIRKYNERNPLMIPLHNK